MVNIILEKNNNIHKWEIDKLVNMAICGEAVQRTLIKSFSYSGKFVMRVGQYN